MAEPKRDKQFVLQQRLGADPDTQARIKRGWDAVGGDDMSGSVGRIFKGVAAQKWGKSSIIGMAKENVFEFPVFVSDSVPLEYATAVNSLLEQVYASYLQMALSIDPVVSSEELRRRGGQFSKFKTNVTKYIECVDLSYQKDAAHNVIENEYGFMEFSMASIDNKDAKVILEALDYVPLSEFDHYFQEATYNKKSEKKTEDARGRSGETTTTTERIANSEITGKPDEWHASMNDSTKEQQLINLQQQWRKTQNDMAKTSQEIRSAAREEVASRAMVDRIQQGARLFREAEKARKDYETMVDNQRTRKKIYAKSEWEEARKKVDETERAYQERINQVFDPDNKREANAEFIQLNAKTKKLMNDYKKSEQELKKIAIDIERIVAQDKREAEKHLHDTKIKASQMMDETKINKLNTMKPLMMVVNMSVMSKEGNISRPIEYMVGVKTHCRLVKAETLPEVVKYPIKEMDEISRKAKWRAGELKFFKDIVFDIKGKKQTAIDSSDPNRKWYRRLFELSHQKGDNNVARMVTGKKSADGLIPNVTLVISKSDVDNIEDVVGIDMMKPENAMGFCSQLFMMGIIVVDIDAESIKILFPDINNDYEVQSLAAVNRQIAQLDTAGAKTRDVFAMLQ